MLIVPLVENKKSKNIELNSEKGLSLYIETNSKKIIFDLGQYDIFKKNATKLGICFNEIDKFIVSHGHYDHFGGYDFLTSHEKENTIFHKVACNNFKMGYIFYKNIGDFKKRVGGVEEQKIEIFKNIYLINTKLQRPSLFCKINGKRDNFEHEYHLAILENGSLNIVTGCCHCGLHELIKKVKEEFPNTKINSISGGLHTRNIIFKSIYIVRGIFLLKSEKVNVLNLGHCTGGLATWILGRFFKVNKLRVGEKIVI